MRGDRGELFDDALMNAIRDRFACVESDPHCGKRTYFENAGGALKLRSVVEVVSELTALPDNAGRDNPASKETDALITSGIEDVRTFLGARSGTIALGESTTSNVFRMLGSIIHYVPGDNVVTTTLDHPATFDATRILAERFRKQWRVAELCRETGIVKPEAILEQIDTNTVVLALIHSSNILGTTNDVKTIIAEARKLKPDLYVLVDGAQRAPHRLVNVEELGCDVYLVSSYKTFSKVGASVVCLSQRASKLPHDRLLGKPDTCWELGTRESASYAAWSKVVDYLCWLGSQFVGSNDRREQIISAMNAVAQHERALTWRMLRGDGGPDGLVDIPGLTVYGEIDDLTVKDPVAIFNVEGMSSAEVVSYLGKKGIVVHSRRSDAYSRHTLRALGIEECVRVSLCHYNTSDEVDQFIGALQRVRK